MTEEVKKKKPRVKRIKPEAIPVKLEIDNPDIAWVYNGQLFDEIPYGIICFVYLITNKLTGKKYIGKKNFFGTKTRSVNKQKVKERKNSDFMEYYGSNDELKSHVVEFGPENFTREILLLCDSLGMASYWEAKYQMHYDVMNGDGFYNSFVGCKIHRKHLKPHQYEYEIKDI